MYKPIRSINEIISLSVMLLLVLALVTSQADATFSDQGLASKAVQESPYPEDGKTALRTTIEAHIGGRPLTISFDAMAGFGNLRFVFK